MKIKNMIIFILLMIVGLMFSVQAGTVGLPTEPRYSGYGDEYRIGIEADVVSNKELNASGAEDLEISGEWYFLTVEVPVSDGTSIYGKIGAVSLASDFTLNPGIKVHLDTDESLALAAGFNSKIWKSLNEEISVVLGADVRWANPDISNIKAMGISIPSGNANAEIWEWQVSLAVSKKIDKIVPYLGVKYSGSDVEINGAGYKASCSNACNIGIFAGAEYKVNDNLNILVECRALDEQAVTVAVKWMCF